MRSSRLRGRDGIIRKYEIRDAQTRTYMPRKFSISAGKDRRNTLRRGGSNGKFECAVDGRGDGVGYTLKSAGVSNETHSLAPET